MSEYSEMAAKREKEAEQLSDTEIFTTIIINLVNQNIPPQLLVQMLLETIEDKVMISSIIKESMKNGRIDMDNGREILKLLNK